MKTSRVDAEPVCIRINVSMLCVLHLAAGISNQKSETQTMGGKKSSRSSKVSLDQPHVATQTLEISAWNWIVSPNAALKHVCRA